MTREGFVSLLWEPLVTASAYRRVLKSSEALTLESLQNYLRRGRLVVKVEV